MCFTLCIWWRIFLKAIRKTINWKQRILFVRHGQLPIYSILLTVYTIWASDFRQSALRTATTTFSKPNLTVSTNIKIQAGLQWQWIRFQLNRDIAKKNSITSNYFIEFYFYRAKLHRFSWFWKCIDSHLDWNYIRITFQSKN